ncbi:major capsid protein [Clostridioides difficile]|uniref:major capsid protein n=1 Tax=Clostridioides difficile TaxID=1496 RepID=UPI00038D1E94|nr:major capsid protein [Clostridioides difficile]EIS9472665.1 major capsid protein [Clostridioides difficile]EIS9653934.1 major capsid protein [Clostridioides difficile]EJA6589956.1 major capsid protein [Clostridioides difficile]EQI78418.1 phage major capsid E family protein [Clostridioides difficile Y401]MCJ0523979.1 major capsid protein [Clostridioides difficile]
MDWKDFIDSKEIAKYIKKLPLEMLIGEALFPRKKQIGMDLKYIKGAKKKPVVLKQSTFDVAVKIRALKAQIEVKSKRMPFFKESVLVNEEDRQQLLLASQAQNKELLLMIISQIYDNYLALVDGGDMQMERMRMQALADGVINIVSEDGDLVFDFEVPSNHKEVLTGSATWDNPDADIIGDIQRWMRIMRDEGNPLPKRMVMTSKTFGYFAKNKAIKLDIDRDGRVILTDEMIKNYLKNKVGLSVAIVSGTYKLEDESEESYFPDNKITFIPDGDLGKTYYGTTPEEADKVYGSKLDCSVVRTGIAITTMRLIDPVTVQTKVSQLGMPSFERADECFFATVA